MNKKLNTLLFFVVATTVNVLLVIVLAVAAFVPYAVFVAPHLEPGLNLLALLVIVVGAMIGSFPLYRLLVNEFQKRVDMEKYFDPIVRQSRRGR